MAERVNPQRLSYLNQTGANRVRSLADMLLRVHSPNTPQRRKQYLHRGEVTGEQAERIRLLLCGPTIEAFRAIHFDPFG